MLTRFSPVLNPTIFSPGKGLQQTASFSSGSFRPSIKIKFSSSFFFGSSFVVLIPVATIFPCLVRYCFILLLAL